MSDLRGQLADQVKENGRLAASLAQKEEALTAANVDRREYGKRQGKLECLASTESAERSRGESLDQTRKFLGLRR